MAVRMVLSAAAGVCAVQTQIVTLMLHHGWRVRADERRDRARLRSRVGLSNFQVPHWRNREHLSQPIAVVHDRKSADAYRLNFRSSANRGPGGLVVFPAELNRGSSQQACVRCMSYDHRPQETSVRILVGARANCFVARWSRVGIANRWQRWTRSLIAGDLLSRSCPSYGVAYGYTYGLSGIQTWLGWRTPDTSPRPTRLPSSIEQVITHVSL